MLFGLAMRFRSTNEKRLNIAEKIVMVLILLSFFAAVISISVTIFNGRLRYRVEQENFFNLTGYMFISLFFLMLLVNVDLMLQIRKKERLLIKNSLKSEKCLLMTILFCFELSYLFRFTYDFWAPNLYGNDKFFQLLLLEDLSYVFEAVSFLALVIFHFKNFRPQASQERIGDPHDRKSKSLSTSGREVVSNFDLVVDERNHSIQESDRVVSQEVSNRLGLPQKY